MNYKPFYQKKSRAIRLWHWSTLIITTLLLFSVFAGKFFLNPYGNSITIHNRLQQLGLHNNPDPSYSIAEILSERVWNWHIWFGYVLTGLFVFRLTIEIFQKKGERFIDKIKNVFPFARKKENRKPVVHFLFVRFIYLLFYLLLAVITGTGLWLAFNRQAGDDELAHSVKEVHETCFYFLLLFILIHTIGVIRAERRGYKNIVSNMIHGGKDQE